MGDIYGDLENYDDFSNLEKLRNENEDLKVKLQTNESALVKLQKDYDTLAQEHQKLLTNFSTLLKTARAEIQRKTDTIVMINKEKDNQFLRMLNNSTKKNSNTILHNVPSNRKLDGKNVETAKNIEKNKQIINPSVDTPAEKHENSNKKTSSTSGYGVNTELPKYDNNVCAVKDKENLEVKTRPASIALRRKSMPVSRFEAKFSSDDDVTDSTHKSKDDIDRPNRMELDKPQFLPDARYSPDERYNVNEPPRYDKENERFRRASHVEQFKFKERRKFSGPRYHRSRRDDFRPDYRSEHRQPPWDGKPDSYRSRAESPSRSDHRHSDIRSELRHSRGNSPPLNRPENRRLRESPSRDIRSGHHRPRTNSPRDFVPEHNRSRSPPRVQHERFRPDSPHREYYRSRANSPPRDMRPEPRSRPESPTRNRYQRTKSRDLRNVHNMHPERPRQPHDVRLRNEEVEEPMTKRRRMDSVHNNTPESIIDVVGEPQGHFSPSQLNTCQSPDETHTDVCINQAPIKEIMHTADTKLEDPRLTSSHYIQIPQEKNKFSLCTTTGRDVRLVVPHWGSSSNKDKITIAPEKCYSVPDLLKEPPTAIISKEHTLEVGQETGKQQTQDTLSDLNYIESSNLDHSLQDLYSDLITNDAPEKPTQSHFTEINLLPVTMEEISSNIEQKPRSSTGNNKVAKVSKDVHKKRPDKVNVSSKNKNAKEKDKEVNEKGKWSVAGDLELSDDSDTDDKPIKKSSKTKDLIKKSSSSETKNTVETIDSENNKTKDIRAKMCDLFGDSSLITPEDLNIPSENKKASSGALPSILDDGDTVHGGFFNELSTAKQQSPRVYIKSSAEESSEKKDEKSDKRKKNNKHEGTKPKNTLELETELCVINISNDQTTPDENTAPLDHVNESKELSTKKRPKTVGRDSKLPGPKKQEDQQRNDEKIEKKKKRNKNNEGDSLDSSILNLEMEKTRLENELKIVNTDIHDAEEMRSDSVVKVSPDMPNFGNSVVSNEISVSINTTIEADINVNRNSVLDSTDKSEESMSVEGTNAPDVRIIVKSRRRKRKLT